ncbi:MAG: hypothetical protein CME25_09990 [Gemmatimonadetes bacterium]|nr:hypothetical protein [Gemmatimonadota bacterium]
MTSNPALKLDPVTDPKFDALTLRAVVIGLVMVLAVNFWISTTEYLIHASRMQLSFFPLALFAVFLLIVITNGLIRLNWPRHALRESELITILAMGFVGAVVPTSGITGFLLGIISGVYYFATPENQWATYLHPNMPTWAVPSNEHNAMTWFYEGLPAGQQPPYSTWFYPIFWWVLIILALCTVLFSIAVILRRQWVQNERLIFPLASVGATVTQASPGLIMPDSFRGHLFWGGFCVGFGAISWNILNYFWPIVPKLPITGQWVVFAKGFPRINTRINFLTAGFAYFANLNVLFSIVIFFIIFFWFENGIINRVGYAIPRKPTNFSAETEVTAWQGFGALTVLVLWNLWTARDHIKAVFLKAFGSGDADDSDELLTYRTAVFGLFGGLAILCGFFMQLGMQGKLVALLIPALIINYLSMARIVAETGLAYMRTTLAEQYAALYTIGTRNLTPTSLSGISLTYGFVCQGKGTFMSPLMHVARLADLIKNHRRRLVPALIAVIFFGLIADFFHTIHLGYQTGAFNFNAWPFSSAGRFAYNLTVTQMRSPFDTSWERLAVFGVGAAAMSILTFLHYRFTWWPFHPIAFPIAFSWNTQLTFFSILVVWAFKATLLRIGGVTLYRKWQPAFLGILVGYVTAVTLSFIVDAIWFPGQGHGVHNY